MEHGQWPAVISDSVKDISVCTNLLLYNMAHCRSPGGTPFRRVRENTEAADNDPGAIIAQALRRKFAHRVFQDSPGLVVQKMLNYHVHVMLLAFMSMYM